jgi:DNA polymerase-3 subunit alpha
MDLFGDFEQEHIGRKIANLTEWPQKQLLSLEREMLGLYISDHPLRGMESRLRQASNETISSFNARTKFDDGESISLAGLLTTVDIKTARNTGNVYANITLEDLDSEVSLLIFNKVFLEFQDILEVDAIVAVRGKMRPRDDSFALNVNSISLLQAEQKNFVGQLKLRIPERLSTRDNILELDKVLSRYPGQTEVQLILESSSGAQEYKIKHRVFVGEALLSEIKQHFGVGVLEQRVRDELTQSFAGQDVSSLVVEQSSELFGQ